ncbi:MAG TPA: aminotransferase class V-fold PLP-dependent enzyme [Vicinamibacterales bacterium]|nr:aminotransferase class V-fold PLP-dependent enzyme [Vicinamibacterales bacterium]
MKRREFLTAALAAAGAARLTTSANAAAIDTGSIGNGAGLLEQAGRPGVFPASVRADFPSAARETYLNNAALHPVGTFAANAMKSVIDYRLLGPGEGRADFGAGKQEDLKKKFGAMINAKATEIAFTANTSDGENIVVMGLFDPSTRSTTGLAGSSNSLRAGGSNIVIDELHFTTSLYMYKELEKKGIQLRIVKHRNWKIDPEDMAKSIDRNTRLVSLAMVSNVNGFMHDVKAVSAIAHARGAHVFADIIQAVGAVPVDVKALGIDFASSGTYKWLMGERGIGFLYVREDLQGTVLPTTRYGHRHVTNFNRAAMTWEPLPGAARYETGGIPVILAAGVSAGIDYVNTLGLTKIRTHAKQLTDRLQKELPPLGYKSLTPPDTETPIVAFELKDAAATQKMLQAGHVAATVVANENRIRLAVSVFNTHEDIDKVVAVLGGKASSI